MWAQHNIKAAKTALESGGAVLHRGPGERLNVPLLYGEAAWFLPSGSSLKLCLKPKDARDTDRLIYISILPADLHENSGEYRKKFSTLTAPFDTLLGVNESTADDETELTVHANFIYFPPTGAEEVGDTFEIRVQNTTYNPDDVTPEDEPTPDDVWVAHGHEQSLTSGQKTQARANIGLDQVNNTSDANKPVSTATQAALDLKANLTDVVGLLDLKGSTNASGNPNYPVALKGDTYLISAAGNVGGASGKAVDLGDFLIAVADNAGGTEASVGTSWFVLEHNLAGITADGLTLIQAANYAAMKVLLGLNNVDNTSDADKPVSTATQTALDLKGDKLLAFRDLTTDHTLELSDGQKMLRLDAATSKTITIPLHADVALPVGTQILVEQTGAGGVAIAAVGGVTLRSRGSLFNTHSQYAVVCLIKKANDLWLLTGDRL